MDPFWERDNNIIYQGHVLDVLKGMPGESVHMCVTSPPYWGLRDYELEPQVWDTGLASVQSAKKVRDCIVNGHKWGEKLAAARRSHTNEDFAEYNKEHYRGGGHKATEQAKTRPDNAGQFCQNCGAWRGSLGLEPTLELYIEHIVQIFREVKRVLRKDGTVWLNLGDSYAGSPSGNPVYKNWKTGGKKDASDSYTTKPKEHGNLKPKDLCMIPARVALALQADGWYLRSDIIWEKPNPMPESVRDRPTKAHEYLFLLSKSHRYYYDIEAIREPYTEPLNRWGGHSLKEETVKHSKYIGMQGIGLTSALREGRDMRPNPAGRNKRSVWNIPTVPFPGAHFATFPEKLIEPCILAGTSEKGCCVECGAPWERVVDVEYEKVGKSTVGGRGRFGPNDSSGFTGKPKMNRLSKTIGWIFTCKCRIPSNPIPCTVLDPFFGAGTTGLVAHKHGRNFIGIELSEEYLKDIAVPRMEKAMKQRKLF